MPEYRASEGLNISKDPYESDVAVSYTNLEEFIEGLRRTHSKDMKILIDLGKEDVDTLQTPEDIGPLLDFFMAWSYRVLMYTKEIIVYVTKAKRPGDRILSSTVLTLQSGVTQDVVEKKATFLVQNGVTEAVVTVEPLRGIYTEDGRMCYILKDGHHLAVAAKELGIPIWFQIEEEDPVITGEELLRECVQTIQGYPTTLRWYDDFIQKVRGTNSAKKFTRKLPISL